MNPGDPVGREEWLYRRSWPEKKFMYPDGTATSRVFKLREKDSGKLSVDIKSLTTPEKAIGDPEKFWLFEVKNEEVIAIPPLTTLYDPLPEGANDAHAVIEGMTIEDDITPGLLARKCKRVYF